MRLGWHHPDTRAEYRDNVHPSQASSRARQQRSLASLRADARVAADAASPANAQQALVSAFVREIGLAPDSTPGLAAVFCGCIAALRAELLHPLRALQEGRGAMEKTMNGQPVPRKPIDAAVDALLEAVLAGRYSDWRYENPFGKAQLHGLTPSQNGFDYEPQCLLPLLCNARNKVVTVDDPAWPQNPSGRAHLRLLHRPEADGGGALLWLEETHGKPKKKSKKQKNIRKNEKKNSREKEYERIRALRANTNFVGDMQYWVQLKTEVLPPVRRAVFAPASPVAVAVANKVEL
ncbi:hypothetical protein T492DRAFT_941679 [Pavlovales sp. CCMP2436]|nr:hypothetical protein T492DRAFT_941679 [Pavlovales sp. CCMP2436]